MRPSLHDPPCELFKIALDQLSAGKYNFSSRAVHCLIRFSEKCRTPEGFANFIFQEADHADSVLQLEISVIPLLLRQLPAREDIPLIGSMHKVRRHRVDTVCSKPLLPVFDLVDHLSCGFPVEGRKRGEAVPIFRQSDGNDRDASHGRTIG